MSFWNFLPTLVTAGATIYGTTQANKTSAKASNDLLKASRESQQAQENALRLAQENLNETRKLASPGLTALQKRISRGSELTPEQKLAVEDSRRESINALKGSSLRGSARATSAVISDTDTRVRNNFMTSNRDSSDNAAATLTGQYFNTSRDLNNNLISQGDATSKGLLDRGNVTASNTIGRGNRTGSAIGDIGGIIADTLKNDVIKARESRTNYEEGA